MADKLKDEGKEAEPKEFRRGKCKWFNVVKGWGFITPMEGDEREIFVHQSVIEKEGFRSLGEGEEILFAAGETAKGMEATAVRAVEGGAIKGSEVRPKSKKKAVRKNRCYNCGEFATHQASNCPNESQPKRCYICKSADHLIGECPDNQEQDKKSGGKPRKSKE